MRIQLIVSTLRGGGAERVAANLATAWSQRGDSVEIVLLGSACIDDYEVDSRVSIQALNLQAPSTGFLSAVRQNIRRILSLRARFSEFSPDVILGIMAESNILIAASSLCSPAISIGTEHSDPHRTVANRHWAVLRKQLYRHLDTIVVLNDRDRARLRDAARVRRADVVPNAIKWPIDVGVPIVDPTQWIPKGAKLILGAGRLDPVKGFDNLILSFANAFKGNGEYFLAILGEGPLRDTIAAQAEALGVSSQLLLPGRVGNIADWYARARIFALTSLSEGMPLALLEAMASGVPAVAFECSESVGRIVRHGENGFLIHGSDVTAFTDALTLISTDDSLHARMSANALEVRQEYSEGAILAIWDRLFADLQERKGETRAR